MLKVTLQQLRLFESVARNRSYTQAAKEVHLSQPAVSIQVKRMEDNLGVTLFEKVGKKLYLTEVGDQLFAMCGSVFSRMEGFEQQLDELRGEVAGPLNIGVATTAKYFLPGLLGEFLKKHPKVAPRLKVTNLGGLITRMDENLDDLYVVASMPKSLDLVSYNFLNDGLFVCAHPQHPLVGKQRVSLKRLAKERMLVREPGSAIRRTVAKHFSDRGVELTPYMELGSGEGIKQGVMAGIGIGVQSSFSLELELNSGQLALLDVEDMPINRHWKVAHVKGKQLSRAARTFVDFLTLVPTTNKSKAMPEL